MFKESQLFILRRLWASMERQLPSPDLYYLKKHQPEISAIISKFIESSEAICERQTNYKGNETGRVFLFLPTGRAINGDRSYLVYSVSRGTITGKRVAYLPMGYDMVKASRQKSLKQSDFLDNISYAERRAKLMSSDVWSIPGKIYHASEHSKEKSMAPIFDRDSMSRLGKAGIASYVKEILDEIYERNLDTAPDIRPDTTNYNLVAGLMAEILTQYEQDIVAKAIQSFRAELDQSSENIMESMKGQVNPQWYDYLTPMKQVETITRNENGKRVKKINKELDQVRAHNRREFVGAYPLASAIDRFWKLPANILQAIDKGENPDVTAAKIWLGKTNESALHIVRKLRGQTEISVGRNNARYMRNIAPYLSFIDDHLIPKAESEWNDFSRVMQADKKLHDCRFRDHGQTISDFAGSMSSSTEWREVAGIIMPQTNFGSPSPIDKIKILANRIGLSNIAVWIRDFIKDHSHYELDWKKEIIPICTLAHENARQKNYSFKAAQMLERAGNFSLVSLMYRGTPIQEILAKAEKYWAEYPEFEEWMKQLALSNLFLGHAKDIEWPAFPAMPEALRGEKQEDGRGMVNNVEHITSSFRALQIAQRMKSLFAFELQESFRSGGHYIAVFRKATGAPLAVCKLMEKQSSGNEILELDIDRPTLQGLYGDPIRLNDVVEDVYQYVDFLNRQQISARTYRNIRAKFEMKARDIATEADSIGYDDSIPEQRFAMTEKLAPYRPDDYQDVSDSGTIQSMHLRIFLGQMYFGREPYRLIQGGVVQKDMMCDFG